MINISKLFLILVIFTFYASAIPQPPPPTSPPLDPRVCTPNEKLPGPCILIYKPVCGVYINSLGQQVRQTFSNRCIACKNSTCNSYPPNATFCIPWPPGVQILCPMIYAPVCGYFNKSIQCFVFPCANNYSNSCLACANPQVDYWIAGVCPTIYSAEADSAK